MDVTTLSPVVVVTGAGSGFGRAAGIRLVRDGWRLAALDVDQSGLEQTLTAIKREGSDATPFVCDVADETRVFETIAAIVDEFGEIGALFNNAGIEGPAHPLGSFPAADLRRVLEVNVVGVFNLLNAVVPSMLRRGGGAIVNTASTASFRGYGHTASAYVASKHAVLGITREAAAQLAPQGIRVNAVAPGCADTPLMDRSHRMLNPDDPAAVKASIVASIPDGRYATAEEVAEVVAFLLSSRSSHVTGVALPVDGGELAR